MKPIMPVFNSSRVIFNDVKFESVRGSFVNFDLDSVNKLLIPEDIMII